VQVCLKSVLESVDFMATFLLFMQPMDLHGVKASV
jgi:hypothetical protein